MPVFLFPGQGSQRAETAKSFYETSTVARRVFDRVLPLLPENVASVLLEGSQEELNDTRNAQPILLCVEMAITAHLVDLGIAPEGCAGHSLGEISALAAADAIPLEAVVPFVVERARLMSENVPEGGMAAVIGMEPKVIEATLETGTQVANFNGPAQTIISGDSVSLGKSIQALKDKGARRVLPLKVSGPFHSQYMKSAAEALEKYLAAMPIHKPKIPVLSSVSGEYEDDPEKIRALLVKQLYAPVQWTTVMEKLDKRKSIEVGPGNTLAGLAKRADFAPDVWAANTPAACESLLGTM